LNDATDLVEAIINELVIRRDYLESQKINSIYLGGGTPSILKDELLEKIFIAMNHNYILSENTEVTIECNPEDITKIKLKNFKKLGINRISIGVQSFNNHDLIFLDRSHDAEQAINAIKLCKKMNFENISIDLMYSLPNQNLSNWEENLNTALNLDIQHISCYSLTVKEKTKLQKQIKQNEVVIADDITSAKHFEILIEKCKSHGFSQYEISNFCKDNLYSKHNVSYWGNNSYLGIGPSAHSYNKKSRQWNVSNNKLYIHNLKENKLIFETEKLSNKDLYNEYIMKTLRTRWGSNIEYIEKNHGRKFVKHLIKETTKWRESGHLYNDKHKIFLTNRGKFISDSVISDLFYT
tara:strand:- start:3977 stop:5029 length:1053 start_codon:yes stop_codon:yes gene_type:complete